MCGPSFCQHENHPTDVSVTIRQELGLMRNNQPFKQGMQEKAVEFVKKKASEIYHKTGRLKT